MVNKGDVRNVVLLVGGHIKRHEYDELLLGMVNRGMNPLVYGRSEELLRRTIQLQVRLARDMNHAYRTGPAMRQPAVDMNEVQKRIQQEAWDDACLQELGLQRSELRAGIFVTDFGSLVYRRTPNTTVAEALAKLFYDRPVATDAHWGISTIINYGADEPAATAG